MLACCPWKDGRGYRGEMTKAEVMSPFPLLQEDTVLTGGWGEVGINSHIQAATGSTKANSSTNSLLSSEICEGAEGETEASAGV